jgi:RsiW-degrading membrane proteinase PrsW (M82 family)
MNNVNFWLSQLIGLEALILLLISYRKKNTNEVLIVQVVSSLCFVVHYLLLGAYSGLLICLIDFFRDILYDKTDKDNLLFILFSPLYILVGIFNFKIIIDVLPTIASLIDGYILTKHKKIVVFGSIIAYALWIIYDVMYKSYSGVLSSSLVIIYNLSILIFDKKLIDNKKAKKVGGKKYEQ